MIDDMTDAEKRNPLVLVADDEKEARMLLRRILEKEDFRVEEAGDGLITVEKAQQLHPDLILMDIQMPNIDGFEAVQMLRDDPRTARIPIIVVTAAAREPADVARGLGLGADDYLRKPYNMSELVARARSNIRARHLEERLQRRTEELEALIKIGSELNQELELDEVADRILEATLRQFEVDGAVLAIVNESHQPTLTRCYGVQIEDQQWFFDPQTLPGYALTNGEAAVVTNVAEDSRVNSIFDNATFSTGIAAPLKHHGEILGVLALGDNVIGRFSAGDFRVLRSIAEQAALAIRNAQLYTELRGYAQGLESMVEARSAALQSAQSQLMRAEKLAALGTLAAGVAHEVNNPLQPLLTNLEMALEDMDAGRPVDRELLEFAEQDVQRIQRIVMRLLDFARPGQSTLEPISVDEVIHEVLSLARKQLDYARVKVHVQLESSRLVNGSADQLKQVFLNLMVNAMEAMPEGGNLYISTREYDNEVYIRVRDTGSGIAQDKLAQVFDPFYTTKADGTGLGLSVSYGIIEGHGGQIEVQSVPDEFTEFIVRLPVLAD